MSYRKTFVEINLNNYIHNLNFFKKRIDTKKIMAVVKADAYGHGAVEISKAGNRIGINNFVVAFLEEALELARSGISGEILILNYFDPKYLKEVIHSGISVSLFNREQIKEWNEVLNENEKKELKIHLNLDTGMRILGFNIEEAHEVIEYLFENGFHLEGIYSHYSDADNVDRNYSNKQLDSFGTFVNEITQKFNVECLHMSNSAAALKYKNDLENYIRLGIYSYGLQAEQNILLDEIKPVMSFKSVISDIKNLEKDDTVGYRRSYKAKKKMRIAVIPVGYADGYSRFFSNNGEVLIEGIRCSIVGKVCMDQFAVDISGINKRPSIGEEVVLFGQQNSEFIKVEELAERIGALNYEITCNISKRVERKYVEIV
jgi:alanine racemase